MTPAMRATTPATGDMRALCRLLPRTAPRWSATPLRLRCMARMPSSATAARSWAASARGWSIRSTPGCGMASTAGMAVPGSVGSPVGVLSGLARVSSDPVGAASGPAGATVDLVGVTPGLVGATGPVGATADLVGATPGLVGVTGLDGVTSGLDGVSSGPVSGPVALLAGPELVQARVASVPGALSAAGSALASVPILARAWALASGVELVWVLRSMPA
ncbi:Mycobacterium terramassiliense ORFan [Mycobacterium terramassiliense]|uniref:Mycobacterium terramassiliense ORFan n=1 Tax=Mycobacterium terramassiliense TaxID=1841859 RepID=A0A2U3NCL9_9MYCO|nr:Mycobacterium terramassiliense ORFan [Mycobacterium terramassiliense]